MRIGLICVTLISDGTYELTAVPMSVSSSLLRAEPRVSAPRRSTSFSSSSDDAACDMMTLSSSSFDCCLLYARDCGLAAREAPGAASCALTSSTLSTGTAGTSFAHSAAPGFPERPSSWPS
eukprot:783259-Pleurochrysis_carterae.AAC.2